MELPLLQSAAPTPTPTQTRRRGVKTSGSLVPSGSRVVPGNTPTSGSRGSPSGGNHRETVEAAAEPVSAKKREPVRSVRVVPVAGDVLQLPAHLLGLLPLRAALRWRCTDGALPFTVTSNQALWVALRASGAVVFGLLELDALTCGAVNDRANAASLRLWCEYKTHAPAWRLTVSEALGGLADGCVVAAPDDMTIGAVMDAWGAELTDVEVFE